MDRDSKVIADVKKIAVLRANGLGDFIFALPALQAIREAYPGAEIVYLGNRLHQELLALRPGPVDRVVIVPRCYGIPNEADRVENEEEVEQFFADMQNEQFDITLQMHGGGQNSNPFVLKLGGSISVGLQAPGAPPLDLNVPYYLCQNEILRYLEVAEKIGARTKYLEPHLSVTAHEKHTLCRKYEDLAEPFVVLHPGASEIRRRWPAEKFAVVGDALAASGFKVVITGSADEQEATERVVKLMKAPAQNLSHLLSVGELVALLSMAEVVVSNDTGPLHVARAVNTPTVGIYWFFNMLTAAPVTVTKNRTCISWNVFCPRCGANCITQDVHYPDEDCRHDVSFVGDVTEEDVLEKTFSLLSHSMDVVMETGRPGIL